MHFDLKKVSLLWLFVFLSLNGSSKEKEENALKRAWNNTIARYNIYFNATQKLEKAKKSIAQNHLEDFSKILSIFQYGTDDNSNVAKNYLEELHKKTSKVIQNRPTSKWVDDSYFLIGLGYFFKRDFFSAIETFQFVHGKYNDPVLKDLAQLWIVKSYLQMGQIGNAESILALTMEDKDLMDRMSRENTKEFHATRADIFLRNNNLPFVINHLEKAIVLSKERTEKYRWHFILGQVNLALNNKAKAKNHFVKVNKLNAPYTYTFQANLGLAKSVAHSSDPKSIKQGIKYLTRMLKDDKNLDYFDQIYFEIAQIEFAAKNIQNAINNLKLSAHNSTKNNNQKASSFLALGKYYFGEKKYPLAQSYYDSTMLFIDNNHVDYDEIKSTHLLLSELIDNLLNISKKDSLLELSSLSLEEIEIVVDAAIEKEKEAKEEAILKQQSLELQNNLAPQKIQQNLGGTWYFYNNAAVARGYTEFKRKWGNRKYSDWWRLNTKLAQMIREEKKNKIKAEQTKNEELKNEEQNIILAKVDQDKRKYYMEIPFGSELKKAYIQSIQNSYLKIGKMYQEDLNNYPLSISNYSTLLLRYPNCSLEPEVLYALYNCYKAQEDEIKMNEIQQTLMDKYPENKYNQLIDGDNLAIGESDSANLAYQKLYQLAMEEKYKSLIEQKKLFDSYLGGNSIQAKFDLLYARAIGALEGKEAYIDELIFVKNSYPNTPESRSAAYAISILESKEDSVSNEMSQKSYAFQPQEPHFFALIAPQNSDIKSLKMSLAQFNTNYGNKTLTISSYLFGEKKDHLLLIKTFPSAAEALLYYQAKELKNIFTKHNLPETSNFIIQSKNLQSLLQNGDWENYKIFFEKNYLR